MSKTTTTEPSEIDETGLVFKVGRGATSRGSRRGGDKSAEYACEAAVRKREVIIVFIMVLNFPSFSCDNGYEAHQRRGCKIDCVNDPRRRVGLSNICMHYFNIGL